jgi:hypothetical protein
MCQLCFPTTESAFDPALPLWWWSRSIIEVISIGGCAKLRRVQIHRLPFILDGVGICGWQRCLHSIRTIGTMHKLWIKGLCGSELVEFDIIGVWILGGEVVRFPKLV